MSSNPFANTRGLRDQDPRRLSGEEREKGEKATNERKTCGKVRRNETGNDKYAHVASTSTFNGERPPKRPRSKNTEWDRVRSRVNPIVARRAAIPVRGREEHDLRIKLKRQRKGRAFRGQEKKVALKDILGRGDGAHVEVIEEEVEQVVCLEVVENRAVQIETDSADVGKKDEEFEMKERARRQLRRLKIVKEFSIRKQ
jgi:hypothetical protein